jgi:precorrin-2/cobalt-factor-2 C20-methyltransferase
MNTSSGGTLYGLGVGPGDPELMTVKAWRVLSLAPVVAWPEGASGESRARAIAAPFIPDEAAELPLFIPFGGREEEVLAAYEAAATAIAEHLDQGRDVAFLCVGDPLTYGTFGKLAALLAAQYPVRAIPGITAAAACAAEVGLALAQGTEPFKMLPAIMDEPRLRAELAAPDAALAIIKAGHHLPRLHRLLHEAGRLDQAVVIEQLGHADQRILPLAQAVELDDASYFSTILVYPAQRDLRPVLARGITSA